MNLNHAATTVLHLIMTIISLVFAVFAAIELWLRHFLAQLGLHGQAATIILVLVANPLKTIRQPWFCDFVTRNVRDKVPLTLALPGPVGMQSGQLPLNTTAMIAATQGSRADVKGVLEKTLKRLQDHTFLPYKMEFSGNDVST